MIIIYCPSGCMTEVRVYVLLYIILSLCPSSSCVINVPLYMNMQAGTPGVKQEHGLNSGHNTPSSSNNLKQVPKAPLGMIL